MVACQVSANTALSRLWPLSSCDTTLNRENIGRVIAERVMVIAWWAASASG